MILDVDRPVEARRGSLDLSIKRATAAVHRRAEGAVAALGVFDSIEAYQGYLAALHVFYSAIEPPLATALRGTFDLTGRRKTPLLEADLRFFDRPPAAGAPVLPRMARPAQAMGVLYVLEGKTLGSRFLLQEARARLGLDAGRGATFFAGYGRDTGARWNEVRAAIVGFAREHGCRQAIVSSARATFESFIRFIEAGALQRCATLSASVSSAGVAGSSSMSSVFEPAAASSCRAGPPEDPRPSCARRA